MVYFDSKMFFTEKWLEKHYWDFMSAENLIQLLLEKPKEQPKSATVDSWNCWYDRE